MICYNKELHERRFNPVLGSSYICLYEKKIGYTIEFKHSNGTYESWPFNKEAAAEQTLEWLDQLYGVKFIPSQILETENKEND